MLKVFLVNLEFGCAEQVFHFGSIHFDKGQGLVLGVLYGDFSAKRADRAFQIPHARFARVPFDYKPQNFLIQHDAPVLKPVRLALFGQ
jgi:hypothetical protein